MNANRLAGHALLHEGAAVQPIRNAQFGRARCTCGVYSALLSSNNERKRWHREHKELIRAKE